MIQLSRISAMAREILDTYDRRQSFNKLWPMGLFLVRECLTRLGLMVKLGGVDLNPILNASWHRRLQTMAVLHYVYAFVFIPVLSLALFSYVFLFTSFWWLMALYLVWFVYDFESPNRGARPQLWFRNWTVWKYMRDFFPISLVKTAPLPPDRNYILGCHPHGVFSFGCFTNFGTEATGFSQLFEGLKPHPCTLAGQFWFPFRRDYILATGGISVSRKSIRHCLNIEPGGHAVIVVVGGAIEALDARPDHHVLTINRRKGFVRLALENGADLVPVYSFGENDVFFQAANPEGGVLRLIQRLVKVMCGFPPPLFYGRGIFNYKFGILPYRKPIVSVVGTPIRVEKVANPSEEQVQQLLDRYKQSLHDLFETHRDHYGVPKDVSLTFH